MPRSNGRSNKLFILAGPSCSAKTPLIKAFRMHYPEAADRIQNVVPYTSRAARPEETDGFDYHFIGKNEIESFSQKKHMISIKVRGDRQAIDLSEIRKMIAAGHVLYEGNTFLAWHLISQAKQLRIAFTSVFLSPFSLSDLKVLCKQAEGKKARQIITDIMRRKLEKRAVRKGYTSDENIEQRALESVDEINLAGEFDFVIVNPLGEESEVWDQPENLKGSARQVLDIFAEIILNGNSDSAEQWPSDLLGNAPGKIKLS